MNGFIYKITNRVNNKCYIGQTRFTIEHRFKQHIKNFNIEHRKLPLYNAFAKYGIENFYVEQLEECDVKELDEREKFWIAKYDSFKSGYNATIGGKTNTAIYIWTDNQYEEIKSLYLSGFTTKDVAKRFNVSSYTIIGILKSMGIKLRNNPMEMNKVEREEVIKSYKEGATLSLIANRYNTDRETVKRFLIKYGVNLEEFSSITKDSSKQEEMITDFLNGMKYKDLEEKYNADTRTLKKILVVHGINIKAKRGLRQTAKGSFCLTDEQCLECIKMYNDKIKVRDIARKYGVNITTVYELFKRYHVKCDRYNHSTSVHSLK